MVPQPPGRHDAGMDILEALVSMGVNQSVLTQDQKRQLDEDGFLYVPGVLLREQVDAINHRLAKLLEAEAENAGKEVHQEPGTDRLSDLINKGSEFHVIFRSKAVLAAIATVLRWDLKLSSLNARAAKPGSGLQALHADWDRLAVPGDYQVCNSIWLLDDFTPENGATRAVAGTHRSTALPHDNGVDPKAPHPQEQLLLGKAGDVFVFNSHTWHGGTLNRTDKPRRAMHAYFCRRHVQQQLDQKKYIRPETLKQLSEAEKVLMEI
jgi:ectoine hydroxylase-related dioxygenase (phytanoyl-CoA dioxygenase family)